MSEVLIIPKALLKIENLLFDTLGFHQEIFGIVGVIFNSQILDVGFFVDLGRKETTQKQIIVRNLG